MRLLHLLSLALAVALVSGSPARAEQEDVELYQSDEPQEQSEGDNWSQEGEASEEVAKTDCSPDPRTVTKTLGGKEVSQETVRIDTASGCIRVLRGGTPRSYTVADSCARCSQSRYGMQCVGSGLAMSMTCDMVLGPDCRNYSVDKSDPTASCE